MSTELELRRGDEVTRGWPASELHAALEAFWSALLEEGELYERWNRTHLFIPGRGDLQVPRNQTRALSALGVRRSEDGFIKALAALHASNLDGPFADLLELPPRLPEEVEQVIAVLRKSLSITAPLRHLGKQDDPLPVPEGAALTLVESHGAYANGAGTMTSVDEWQLEVLAPVRLRIIVQASDEYGTATHWSIKLTAATGTPIDPLLDAFKEQDLNWVRVERVRGLDST